MSIFVQYVHCTYLDTLEASVQDRNKYWEVHYPVRQAASVEAVIEVPLTWLDSLAELVAPLEAHLKRYLVNYWCHNSVKNQEKKQALVWVFCCIYWVFSYMTIQLPGSNVGAQNDRSANLLTPLSRCRRRSRSGAGGRRHSNSTLKKWKSKLYYKNLTLSMWQEGTTLH